MNGYSSAPKEYKYAVNEEEKMGKHVIIRLGCTIPPGVTIFDDAAFGAMSLYKASIEHWKIYAGILAKMTKDCRRELLDLERKYLDELHQCN